MLGASSLVNNYSGVFGVQSAQPIEQLTQTLLAKAQSGTAAQGHTADSVTISSSAMLLQQFLNSEMQGGADMFGGAADLGEVDLLGLTQLKQRGDMLASMLQLKMKNFESQLMSSVQGAGLPMQEMHLTNGEDGLSLLGDMPNKEAFQDALAGLQGEFSDLSRMAEVLTMLQSMGQQTMGALSSTALQYAQQSTLDRASGKRPESGFVMHVMPSGTSFSFE